MSTLKERIWSQGSKYFQCKAFSEWSQNNFDGVAYPKSITISLNPFIPKFLTWTLPSLTLDTSIVANWGFSKKINNEIPKSVDPDETARYEPSHLYLHCLQWYLYWSVGLKELKSCSMFDTEILTFYLVKKFAF